MRTSLSCLLTVVLCIGFLPAAMAAQGKACEWRDPGHDPYMGDLPSAVDHYTDIPTATRQRLKERMNRLAYDDMVTIRKGAIEGRFFYEPAIRDMHFGEGRTCPEVTRQTWPEDHTERALVYCEGGFCVMVPFVCRNVSRIRQRPAGVGAVPAAPAGRAAEPAVPMPIAMQQTPPPPPAWPLEEAPTGSQAPLSSWLRPPQSPAFPSRIDFPDEPAIAYYPPWVIPPQVPPFLPLVPSTPFTPTPGDPPPATLPPVDPQEPPYETPTFPTDPQLPHLPPISPVTPIPEPGTGLLLGAGLLLLLASGLRAAKR